MRSFATSKTGAALIAAALLAAGCSGQQGARPASSPPATLANPLDFPLYPRANVVSTRAFTQKINAQAAQGSTSIFSAGNGTYSGHEVIASSQASFSELSSWVQRVNDAPPAGYTAIETGNNPAEHEQAERYGIDYATFRSKTDGSTRGVLVIVMDPERVNQRFGAVLGMISRYRALPEVMRAPIDNEAKSRIGMTLSEATAPESPVGAALSALGQLQNKNARGIVLIDASKR
jgi:hypothetical protein